ncbi:MAG TPA: putative LPS assembly protein LptD [Bacteroidia bacterium]|nr:putative LPS assembly protein LptD [Bacteroidia bacterium]HRS57606.1 putative LPS assembly protein LptD [Bacteroidia bacterium]HRU67192.1 putative LPS assembly protein LptD [Bacteroidia bacterium]
MKILYKLLILTTLWICFGLHNPAFSKKTFILPPDSIKNNVGDTQFISKDAIKSKINYTAKDSIPIDLKNNLIYLYGEAEVSYEQIRLKAAKIIFDWKNSLVTAEGIADSLGNVSGNPVFYDKDQEYKAEKIIYNFKTKKGKLYNLLTVEGEGYIHGQEVMKDENDVLYARQAKYTTCNDEEHPHFYISASKIKVLKKNIISGPAWLVIEDVPLPLGVPFGFFPKKDNRSSGILLPAYGESTNRGFYLRGGGYYFSINDYLDLALRGDIYSRGSWLINASSNYKVRYKFSGNLSVQYANNRYGEPNDPDFSVSKDFSVNWSHTQDPKSMNNASFRANVNAGSRNSFRNNSTNAADILQNTLRSSITYSKAFKGTPFSLSAGISHSQNLNSGSISISAPDFSFNMNRITPFKSKTGKRRWYSDIGLRYSLNSRNTLNTVDTAFLDPQSWRKWENGIQHSLPISTSFKMLRYFTLSPSVDYTGYTYFRKIDKTFVKNYQGTETDTILVSEENGIFQAHDVSVNANLSTRIYGMFNINKWNLVAMRHLITPTVSFSYRPDFSDPRFGYYKKVALDSTGLNFETYSVFKTPIYGTPGRFRQGNIIFNIQNNFELKVLSKPDTSGKRVAKKIKLLDYLNFSGSYNFFADSFQMSNIRFSGRTSLFKNKLNLQFSGDIDPYTLTSTGKRISKYEWDVNKRIGRLTNAYISVNSSLNSNPRKEREHEFFGFSGLPYESYVDFEIPWNLSWNYTFSFNKPGLDAKITQTVTLSGNINLTPKWKINVSTGYDLSSGELTFTSVDIYRDLHCWEMSFHWIPFGYRQSYMFKINVKASVLKDLKIDKKKEYFDYQ